MRNNSLYELTKIDTQSLNENESHRQGNKNLYGLKSILCSIK